MGKKSKDKLNRFDYDQFDDFDDDDISVDLDAALNPDWKDLSRDFYSTDQDDWYVKDDKISARRKIERRQERRALYRELDDWQNFGAHADL